MPRNLFTLFLACFALSAFDFAQAQAPKLNYSVSWIGNSYNGKTAWTLQDVDALCVLPDGTLFTNVFWDENGGNVQEYRAGEMTGIAEHTHGWGYNGGAAVAANSKYLFIAQQVDNEGSGLKGSSWPEKGLGWCGISRRLRSDIRQPAPFYGGRGGQGDTLRGAYFCVREYPEGTANSAIRGMCADETRLFFSSPLDNAVKIYDAEGIIRLKSIPVSRPDRICLDKKGKLWILQKPETADGAWIVLRFDANGTALPQKIALPVGVLPTDICVDARNRLLIADAGPDNQIKIYEDLDADPKLAGTFGVRGGIFAQPTGKFGDLRFNRPVAVGADNAGRIYVVSDGQTGGGGTILECYNADSKLQWRRFGLTFVDCPAANPRNPTEIFTKEEHFTLDYSRPPGHDWTYRGYTVNPAKYPDDPRLHLGSTNARVEILDGKPFLFVSDMTGEYLHVYRFNSKTDGETAIPCVLFARRPIGDKKGYPAQQPERGEWVWTDKNGDGKINADEFQTNGAAASDGLMTLDAQGTIWQAENGSKQMRALPLQNVDAKGIPHWDYRKAKTFQKPPELDEIRRLRYLPDRDVMLLGGNRGDNHNQHWKPMGPVLCVYDHWRGGKPVLQKSVVLPYEKGSSGHESAEPISFDVVGEYVFVAYTRGLKADGIKNAFIKILRLSNLSVVGNLSAESEFGETGLLDLVESASAVRRPNGEYVVFLEDDAKAKIVTFRWRPAAIQASGVKH